MRRIKCLRSCRRDPRQTTGRLDGAHLCAFQMGWGETFSAKKRESALVLGMLTMRAGNGALGSALGSALGRALGRRWGRRWAGRAPVHDACAWSAGSTREAAGAFRAVNHGLT